MSSNFHYQVRSQELNYLVFRYLQECGYRHSAFTFAFESQIKDSKIDGAKVPPGALLSFMQRGVDFLEIEQQTFGSTSSMLKDTTAKDGAISLLDLHRYMCDPVGMKYLPKKKRSRKEENAEIENESIEHSSPEVLALRSHFGKIYGCAWNPRNSLFVTACEDSTARIWNIPEEFAPDFCRHRDVLIMAEANTLLHSHIITGSTFKKNDVTAVDWNPDGTLVATGSQDGGTRLWTADGELLNSLDIHKDAVLSLKWNKTGTHFVTGSFDNSVGIWNGHTGSCIKNYPFHDGPIVDIDWKDDSTFVTASSDARVLMCSINSHFPLLTFRGHEAEVNMVRLSPHESLLASAGDDKTVRLWCTKTSEQLHKFSGHEREVYCLDWCPVENRGHTLASGSFDATVKLWDVKLGLCMRTLYEHTGAIYCLKYSNDGKFLASGSMNGSLVIWNSRDGTIVKKLKSSGAVHELAWSKDGRKIAVCISNGLVSVVDLRKMHNTL